MEIVHGHTRPLHTKRLHQNDVAFVSRGIEFEKIRLALVFPQFELTKSVRHLSHEPPAATLL